MKYFKRKANQEKVNKEKTNNLNNSLKNEGDSNKYFSQDPNYKNSPEGKRCRSIEPNNLEKDLK